MYSKLREENQGHLGQVLTGVKYSLIYQTPFVHTNNPVPPTIPSNPTADIMIVMNETHTEDLRVFCKVMGVDQALIQPIIDPLEKAYIMDIRYRNKKSIKIPIYDLIANIQDTYGKLMPYNILEQEDIGKMTSYNPWHHIGSIYSTVKELLEFLELTGTPISHAQQINISYVSIHNTGQYALAICE